MKLVIFDLDQTLVDVVVIHNGAAEVVFRNFFNVKAKITEVDYAGRSLFENFLAVARLKGLPETRVRELLPAMLEAYEKSFVAGFAPDSGKYVLPGVRELLEALKDRGHYLVLYTGDSRVVAEKILEATGLQPYFRLFLFGTEVRKRSDMVRTAIEEASRAAGRPFTAREVVVVGDSIRDVESGREYGAVTVAVATGFHSADELRKTHPDFVFADLKDHRAVLNAIDS